MKKIYSLLPQLLVIVILAGFVAKYYFESVAARQDLDLMNKTTNETQILSMDEIRDYYGKKGSYPSSDLIITVSDFKKGTYAGSISPDPKKCMPNDFCGGSIFLLSKKNGVIFSEETNGDFNCKSLTDKGFDISTVNSLGMSSWGMTCYSSQ